MTKGKTIKLPWKLFKKACKFYGVFRAGDVSYFDDGTCRETYGNPKRCYTRRCPIIKGGKI